MQKSNNIQPWKELEREEVFKKYSRRIDKITFELPDKTQDDFYIKVEGPAVGILGITNDNKLILVEQFRPGPQEILLEIPGGFIDPGEQHLETAKREFLEETGYTGDFDYVGSCLDDAYSTMKRHYFVAKNCKKISEPQNTATEHTRVVLLSIDEFRKLLRSGNLTDTEIGYLCFDYLKLL